jgi:hypothetical protein
MKKLAELLFMFILILSLSTASLAAYNQPSDAIPVPVGNAAEPVSTPADTASLPGGAYIGNESPRLSEGEPGSGDITSPLDYWNTNGWPADISFAYNGGGEIAGDDKTILNYWEIGVVNATAERKREITELFASTCLITFHAAKYSHAEREAILTEIEIQAKESRDSNLIYGCLINNTEKIYVVVKDTAFDEYSARYAKSYGDLIWVQKESEAVSVETITGNIVTGFVSDTEESAKWYLWALPILLCVFVLAAAALYFKRLRLLPARQTADGKTVVAEPPLTREQTVKAIKNSNITPRNGVFDDICKRIEK